MQNISSLSAIIGDYDALLLDLWGVIHDGTNLYPGVHDALKKLHEHGKKIIMVSNAPRRIPKVEAVLAHLGIRPPLYDHVISSGELGYRWLKSGLSPWGKRYYYIGPSKDADVLNGLDYKRVDDLKETDFLLNVGFGSEEQSTQDLTPLLRAAKALALPMLCLNPDLEVVKITGERHPCAGVIAHAYEAMGGEVTWFGKPYPAVYEYCMELLAPIENARTLAIGDSIGTDITGAVHAGIDCALVTGGILKGKTPQELADLCDRAGVEPTYVMPRLAW